MKTTCLGILVWTLLLPALAIESNEELQDEGSDVPKQSRIKREVILADEIYVDDLDEATTDALGEIVVKRVLHSPIARRWHHPQPDSVSSDKVVYVFENRNLHGEESDEDEDLFPGSARQTGEDNYETSRNVEKIYVLDGNTRKYKYLLNGRRSSGAELTRNQQRRRQSNPRLRSVSEEAVTMSCKQRGDTQVCTVPDQRRGGDSVQAASRRTFASSSQTDEDSGQRIYVIQSESAKDEHDEEQLAESEDEDEVQVEEKATKKTEKAASASEEEDDDDDDDDDDEDDDDEVTEREQAQDDDNGGDDDDNDKDNEEKGEVQEQVVNRKRCEKTYNNNIEFHCNCGYRGDKSQIGSHVCQYSSNSSTSSNSSSVGEKPSGHYKTIVIMKKYPGERSKKKVIYIMKTQNPENVEDVESSEQEEATSDSEENDYEVGREERESQGRLNVRRQNNRGSTGRVVIVKNTNLVEGDGVSSDESDEDGETAPCGLCDGVGKKAPREVIYVRTKPGEGTQQVVYVRNKKQGLRRYVEEEDEPEEEGDYYDDGSYYVDDYISRKPNRRLIYVNNGRRRSGKKYISPYKVGRRYPEDYYVEGDLEHATNDKNRMIIIRKDSADE